MNPNVTRKATRKRSSGSFPVSTIARSYRLPILATTTPLMSPQTRPRRRRELSTRPALISRDEHDLADVAALLHEAMGLARGVERERLRDDGLQLTGLERGAERLNDAIEIALAIPPVEHVEPEHSLVLVHHREALPPWNGGERHPGEVAKHGGDVAGVPRLHVRQPVHDQPPSLPQQPVVLAEARRAERVHDHVQPLPAGDPPHLRGEVLGAVVDRVVDSLGAYRVVLGRRGRAEHLRAARSGDLR